MTGGERDVTRPGRAMTRPGRHPEPRRIMP
jgi:hypothetical protein